VEVIESRTPLLLKEFGIRKGSGGEGKWKGGDGCYRHFIAMTDLNASIVSQRRVYAPFGMKGGGSGKRGENLLIRKRDGKDIAIALGHNGMARLHKGDEVRIESPGGGGWGTRN
jgi:5-oxoprolinase (ATP-hydrolysing)